MAFRVLFETETSVQRRSDIDHVYALEEIVQGRRGPKGHSSGEIFPHRNDHSRDLGRYRTPLKGFLNSRLLTRRSRAERTIDGHDDQILSFVSEVRDLKGRHRVGRPRSRFSHASRGFNCDAIRSMSVSYPGVSVSYHPSNSPLRSLRSALLSFP